MIIIFLMLKSVCHKNKYIHKSIELLKDKGYNLVVATNPLFPLKAILHRIQWAGLSADISHIYLPMKKTITVNHR